MPSNQVNDFSLSILVAVNISLRNPQIAVTCEHLYVTE